MILLAKTFNARIYIHLNRRNAKMIALEMMEDLAHSIKSNQFYLSKIYSSACGRHHSEKDKTWIIDYDYVTGHYMETVDGVIIDKIATSLALIEPLNTQKILARIPTKNGIHLICKPFNSQKFKELYPKIEIHKNNPVNLFIP